MEGLQELNNTGSGVSVETRIRMLFEEIEVYRQAIQDAKDALAAAEMELDEELDARWQEMQEGGNADD